MPDDLSSIPDTDAPALGSSVRKSVRRKPVVRRASAPTRSAAVARANSRVTMKGGRGTPLRRNGSTLGISLQRVGKWIVFSLCVLLALALLYILLSSAFSYVGFLMKPNPVQKNIDRVSTHMLLPTGEEPSQYEVSDPGKLPNALLFSHAIRGDVLLVYPVSHTIVLYRPSIDKLISTGQYEDPGSAAAPVATTASTSIASSTVSTASTTKAH